jgi:hypothetical protein
MEAKFQNKEIMEKTLESRLDAQRKFKKCRTDSKVEAKIKRDCARMKRLLKQSQSDIISCLVFMNMKRLKCLTMDDLGFFHKARGIVSNFVFPFFYF